MSLDLLFMFGHEFLKATGMQLNSIRCFWAKEWRAYRVEHSLTVTNTRITCVFVLPVRTKFYTGHLKEFRMQWRKENEAYQISKCSDNHHGACLCSNRNGCADDHQTASSTRSMATSDWRVRSR